ncbi:MAG TPA: RNA polymerase sigma factor [Nocardioidaceae bacterium]|nr:RNA polymerase sigma factor [Nocardioidaceae bacterium]
MTERDDGADDSGSVSRIGSDPDALEAFYRQHVEAVQRFVARRVDDPHLAADLTAEIFLAAVGSAAGYRPERGRPAAWLYGIGRNVIATELRRQRRHQDLLQRVRGRRVLEEDALGRIEERLATERQARLVMSAVAKLSSRDRAIVELVDLDGLEVQEAAAVLGLKPGTARVRLHRARSRIKSLVVSHPLPAPLATLTQEV